MQSQKHQQEQGISSLFMSQAYTNWEGLVSRHFIMCLSFSLFLPILLLFSILFILHRPCPSPINPITQSPYTGIFS